MLSILVKQVIQVIIIPTTFPSVHSDLLCLLLLLAHSFQDRLELLLVDLLPQLSTARQHDQTALDVFGAGGFDETNATDAVGGFGLEDLREDGCAGFGFASPGSGC
jgi:hypothetical protein